MRKLPLICLLVLSACGPKPKAPPPPSTVAAASPATPSGSVSDFGQDIDALGTEPFWTLKIRGATFILSRPEHPDVTAKAPGAEIRPGAAAWTATTADGVVLKVKLYVSDCSDGMSDHSYPMSAEVDIAGVMLTGCAIRTADAPPPGT